MLNDKIQWLAHWRIMLLDSKLLPSGDTAGQTGHKREIK